ncbi:unnamed protein product [Lactuca saligna]|uniref:Uncharacterized protein n=1 Tax=Lactuca saligna TaxID=75948 RepID=A0AA36EC68_LACSI|nr:unnamed protein product [Lactuca saligna]
MDLPVMMNGGVFRSILEMALSISMGFFPSFPNHVVAVNHTPLGSDSTGKNHLGSQGVKLGRLKWVEYLKEVTKPFLDWNVLLHDLFKRLFRQDLLVVSLFRNFLLAERIMRSANCSPVSYPMLPPTHQHHMWDAWDIVAEICLSQLPTLLEDPNAEF